MTTTRAPRSPRGSRASASARVRGWLTATVLVLGAALAAAALGMPTLLGGSACADAAADVEMGVTSVIVVGGLGDLARKYLWQAAFNLFLEDHDHKQHTYHFYASGRREEAVGTPELEVLLRDSVSCAGAATTGRQEYCTQHPALIPAFKDTVRYAQLKTSADYAALSERVAREAASPSAGQRGRERGRVFFVAVAPDYFGQVTSDIKANMRPKGYEVPANPADGADAKPKWVRPFFRVALEKPFGSDLRSAEALADAVDLEQTELRLVDHYLGKSSMHAIGEFRAYNTRGSAFGSLLSQGRVQRVEVVMTEALSAAGRTQTYDSLGVIRDTFQNHMSEMLAFATAPVGDWNDENEPLVIADAKVADGEVVDANEADILAEAAAAGKDKVALPSLTMWLPTEARKAFFDNLHAPRLEDAALAQYNGYAAESLNDRGLPFTAADAAQVSTVTAARVVVNTDLPPLRGVPIVFVGGKALRERATYVRYFFTVDDGGDGFGDDGKSVEGGIECDITYSLNGPLKTSVSVSANLPAELHPARPPGWQKTLDASGRVTYVPPDSDAAYTQLFANLVTGDPRPFLSQDEALALWRVWTPLIDEIDAAVAAGRANELVQQYEAGTGDLLWAGVTGMSANKEDVTTFVGRLGMFGAFIFAIVSFLNFSARTSAGGADPRRAHEH